MSDALTPLVPPNDFTPVEFSRVIVTRMLTGTSESWAEVADIAAYENKGDLALHLAGLASQLVEQLAQRDGVTPAGLVAADACSPPGHYGGREPAEERKGKLIMYVVIEYNQASGRPGLPDNSELHDSLDDARDDKEWQESHTREAGRRETYAIAEVTFLDEEV